MKRVNKSFKHSTYFLAQQNLLSALKSSQRDIKEMPKKRLRVPPNSATKEDMLNVADMAANIQGVFLLFRPKTTKCHTLRKF